MRALYKLPFLFFAFLVLTGCGASNKIVEPTSMSRAVDEMVLNKQFILKADWARPMMTNAMSSIMTSGLMPPGNSVSQINIMGSGYFFKMEGDSVSAHLPYFGERQMGGGYGSDNGIKFQGVPRDLKIEKDEEKLRHSITFNISKETETYRCRLDLTRNQTGTLLINSSQRFTIRYEGKVDVMDSEKTMSK